MSAFVLLSQQEGAMLTFGQETVRTVGACDGGQVATGVVVNLVV